MIKPQLPPLKGVTKSEKAKEAKTEKGDKYLTK